MPYWIYSPESLPSDKLMGKTGYSPEWFQWGGARLPQLFAGQWTKIPDNFYVFHRASWRERPVRELVAAEEILEKLSIVLGKRGVKWFDHDPTPAEKEIAVSQAKEVNDAWRMGVIEDYEKAVEDRKITGTGRTRPTPYEDECYDLLGVVKPYSVEAMRAQRHPGESVGEQIVAALDRLDQRRRAEVEAQKSPERKRLESIAAEADNPKGLVPAMRK